MNDIRELTVTQVRLFPVDTVPLDIMLAQVGRKALTGTFGFAESGLGGFLPDTGPFPQLLRGEFEDDGSHVVIQSLAFEPRRIVSKVAGTSGAADRFFEKLVAVLEDLVPNKARSLSQPIVKAEETTCVAHLDLDLSRLLRAKASSFVKRRLARAASKPLIPARSEPFRFAARIEFDVRDQNIKDHGITLNPKEFMVERRANTPRSARVFFTKSPFPTDVHLQLLDEFEQLFASKAL